MTEKIEFAYPNALERHVDKPIVFVLDVRDNDAAWVAEQFTDKQKIKKVTEDARKRETAPALSFAASKDQAEAVVRELDPQTRDQISSLEVPDDQFFVIAIADGSIGGCFKPKP